MERIEFVDSHTGGEPTRVVVSGGPDLGSGPLPERVEALRTKYDRYRQAIVNEPRGNDVLVGAWLVEPTRDDCASGVIFFNNVGPLRMCGHGTIGVVATLAHLGRIGPGRHRLETPVGIVDVELEGRACVTLNNVPSYLEASVEVELPGRGVCRGDVVWGGNWFFLSEFDDGELTRARTAELVELTRAMRAAVNAAGYPLVDHIELSSPIAGTGADARNFVLCPGSAYDRSPCGTGTSAKLAALAASGKLAEGQPWVQESIIGSRFVGRYRWEDSTRRRIVPQITGTAYMTAEGTLLLDAEDPFCWGIASPMPEA